MYQVYKACHFDGQREDKKTKTYPKWDPLGTFRRGVPFPSAVLINTLKRKVISPLRCQKSIIRTYCPTKLGWYSRQWSRSGGTEVWRKSTRPRRQRQNPAPQTKRSYTSPTTRNGVYEWRIGIWIRRYPKVRSWQRTQEGWHRYRWRWRGSYDTGL